MSSLGYTPSRGKAPACWVRCRLGELPDAVGGLSQLQTLLLASCGLRQLPETVGRLQRLITLDVSKNGLRELPASVGELPPPLARWIMLLQTLRTCHPVNCRRSLVHLADARVCYCGTVDDVPGGSLARAAGPPALHICDAAEPLRLRDMAAGDCRALERLSADSNQLTALPDSLSKLKSLAVVSAARNRCAMPLHLRRSWLPIWLADLDLQPAAMHLNVSKKHRL